MLAICCGCRYGDGSQTRSFCYVDDLVEGLVRLMNQDETIGPVNLGNPREVRNSGRFETQNETISVPPIIPNAFFVVVAFVFEVHDPATCGDGHSEREPLPQGTVFHGNIIMMKVCWLVSCVITSFKFLQFEMFEKTQKNQIGDI